MRNVVVRAMGVLACVGLLAGSAEASTISIQATTITSGDVLAYYGLGDIGGGVGHGTYQLGSCSFSAGRTSCVTTGTYVEVAGSANPGATGSFSWRMTWLGNVPNPIEAASISAGNNTLQLFSVPAGAFFEVTLSGGQYANLDFGAIDTPNPQNGTLNWQAFLNGNPTCTGSPANCSVGAVGLASGSSISSALGQFNMQLDYPGVPPPSSSVPEPSTWMLLGTGVAALAARRRLRA